MVHMFTTSCQSARSSPLIHAGVLMGTPICVLIASLLDLGVHVQVYSSPVPPSESSALPVTDGNAVYEVPRMVLSPVLVPWGVIVVESIFVELVAPCLPPSLAAPTEMASTEMKKGFVKCIGGVKFLTSRECMVCWRRTPCMSLYTFDRCRVGSVGLGSLLPSVSTIRLCRTHNHHLS
ncbi:uncharacterized protein EV420DRAFT_1082256 [Desarmillaria tabescens]|uniref:Uncharacterized protein n=1 Tax=Armillaria tabescens TaxID=1929756 RepID=A0AA39JGE5_ARMTA|nr:uncharacterized protein EV420DRAFT_1082256 [Desarmillaria tabescens]KAK0442311.1 hypothetical protein EV420DRAFT_1082256 [Desarmillaria tabescens]